MLFFGVERGEYSAMKKTNRTAPESWSFRIDLPLAFILGAVLYLTVYIALGFAKYGMTAPYFYAGVDDFSEYAGVLDDTYHDWDERVGALNTDHIIGSAATRLLGVERVVTAFCYLLTHHVAKAMNLRLLLCFALTGVSAFVVLRVISLRRFYAFAGGLLYGLAPYIFYRHVEHICLSAAYFVPLGLLLCWWAYTSDGTYLKPGKGFFRDPRNIATLIACALIPNNGVGYYPFFVCFFLATTFFLIILRECRSGEGAKHAILAALRVLLIQVGIIALFLIIAVMPYLLQLRTMGGNVLTSREYWDLEGYSLKITLMFLPISSHGIPVLGEIIKDYYVNMPLVNENASEYLGICGILGLLTCMCYLMRVPMGAGRRETVPVAEAEKDSETKKAAPKKRVVQAAGTEDAMYEKIAHFTSASVLMGLLFFTVGGAVSFLFFVLKLYYLRGFNRISIYMLFLCILALMNFLQKWEGTVLRKGNARKHKVFLGCVCALVLVSALEQIPTTGAPVNLTANKTAYESDASFVGQMEKILGEGAMVYQLPYHGYPEGVGKVNDMENYHLLAGYMHSKTLRWSFGEIKGTEEDEWCMKTASLLDPAITGYASVSQLTHSRESTGEMIVENLPSGKGSGESEEDADADRKDGDSEEDTGDDADADDDAGSDENADSADAAKDGDADETDDADQIYMIVDGRITVAGTAGEEWKEEVDDATAGTREFLEEVRGAGFTGLYIDSRAYTERQLRYLLRALNRELGGPRLISNNRNLYFYDLRP